MNINAIKESMQHNIESALAYGESLESIKDSSNDFIDGFLPIYTHDVIQEWQHMPSEYDNRGAAELGARGESDIVNLMRLDLYLFYSELFNDVIEKLEAGASNES